MKRSRAVLPHLLAAVPLVAVISVRSVAQTADSSHAPAPRLIGVFDSRTGAPLPDVQVRDVFSGTYAVTTTTGTVRLDYLTFRGAAAFIELRRLGYQLKQIVVNRADTTPITEVMEPVVTLPRVVTTARYRIDRDAGRWDGFDERCSAHVLRGRLRVEHENGSADRPNAGSASRGTVHAHEREGRRGVHVRTESSAAVYGRPDVRRDRHLDEMMIGIKNRRSSHVHVDVSADLASVAITNHAS